MSAVLFDLQVPIQTMLLSSTKELRLFALMVILVTVLLDAITSGAWCSLDSGSATARPQIRKRPAANTARRRMAKCEVRLIALVLNFVHYQCKVDWPARTAPCDPRE
jgi:hypothetical protein